MRTWRSRSTTNPNVLDGRRSINHKMYVMDCFCKINMCGVGWSQCDLMGACWGRRGVGIGKSKID